MFIFQCNFCFFNLLNFLADKFWKKKVLFLFFQVHFQTEINTLEDRTFPMNCSSLTLAPAKLLYATYILWKEGAISASEKTKGKCKQ